MNQILIAFPFIFINYPFSMRFVGYLVCCKFFFVLEQIFRRRWHQITNRREIFHDGMMWVPEVAFPILEVVPPRIPKIQNFGPLKSEHLESGKSQHVY